MKGREIIYIGKATSLRSRVQSYFRQDLMSTRGPVVLDMVFKATGVKFEETDSVLEALILEANLIKKHQPKSNTKEKDDKSFNYVCITREELPKVVVVRGKEIKERIGAKNFRFQSVFGPFPSGPQLREALKIVRRIFPFLDDKSKNYLEFYQQINLAPDLKDHKMYHENIKNIKLFFKGKKKEIFRNLKKEMNTYAKSREFEKAGEIKRQLFALQHINDVALLKNHEFRGNTEAFRVEAYDIAHMSGKNMVGVMVVVENGVVNKNEYRKFKVRTQINTNDTGALSEVIERRLGHPEWPYPDLIVVDGSTAQINTAKKVLAKAGKIIPVVSVIKDERHKPKGIGGDKKFSTKFEKEILLGNSEAHRFAITYHKNMRSKNFLK